MKEYNKVNWTRWHAGESGRADMIVERAARIAFASLARRDRDHLIRLAADEVGGGSLLHLAIERGRAYAMKNAVIGIDAHLILKSEVTNDVRA